MDMQNIETWGNTLSEFTYAVTRETFTPQYWHSTISKREPMGMLTTFVNSIGQYELFEMELLELMSEKRNPEMILKLCDEKIMPSIRNFKQWYSNHARETEIFGAYNPYMIMHELMTRTEKALTRYGNIPKGFPDKYYAWYHLILTAVGKEPGFSPGSKQDIIALGRNKYGAKSGFYQAFINFDLTKKQSFVNSLSDRDRRKWKSVITELSNNDNDVINFLKQYPD